MNEKKKMLLSQILEITKKIEELKLKREKLIEGMKDIPNGIMSGSDFSDVPDYSMKEEADYIRKEIEKLEELLANVEVIVEYDDNAIDIGTRFTATVAYEEDDIETQDYILVSTKEGSISALKRQKDDPIYVTPESPFGAVVMGKRIGEGFYYQVNNDWVVGFIEDITPNEKIEEKGFQKIK